MKIKEKEMICKIYYESLLSFLLNILKNMLEPANFLHLILKQLPSFLFKFSLFA